MGWLAWRKRLARAPAQRGPSKRGTFRMRPRVAAKLSWNPASHSARLAPASGGRRPGPAARQWPREPEAASDGPPQRAAAGRLSGPSIPRALARRTPPSDFYPYLFLAGTKGFWHGFWHWTETVVDWGCQGFRPAPCEPHSLRRFALCDLHLHQPWHDPIKYTA